MWNSDKLLASGGCFEGWSYFCSFGGSVVGGELGEANGAAKPPRRWRRVVPISDITELQTAFRFFSVVSVSSAMRLSDCWVSLVTTVRSQAFDALPRRFLCSSMAAMPSGSSDV